MGVGTAAIVLNILGLITTIVLYVLFPLPMAWKIFKHQQHFVDLPVLVTLPSFCYNLWGIFNVLAMSRVTNLVPFYFPCLALSHLIGLSFVVVYFYIFVMTQDITVITWGAPQQYLCVLSVLLVLFMELILMFLLLDFTGIISKLSGILSTLLGITMYASPLPVVMNRRNMKTVQSFALWLSVLFFFYAFSWCLVALVARPYDPYLFITNGVGTLLGLVHIGIIVNSTWSAEIPRILECWISLIRERGMLYTVKSIMDIEVNEKATELEPNETATNEKADLCVKVIVQ